jgi:hypothetical protein
MRAVKKLGSFIKGGRGPGLKNIGNKKGANYSLNRFFFAKGTSMPALTPYITVLMNFTWSCNHLRDVKPESV